MSQQKQAQNARPHEKVQSSLSKVTFSHSKPSDSHSNQSPHHQPPEQVSQGKANDSSNTIVNNKYTGGSANVNNGTFFNPKQDTYQSALGINFEKSKVDSPTLSHFPTSPNLDYGDLGLSNVRSDNFDFYKTSNNSETSITQSLATTNTTNNKNTTISSLMFSPLSSTRSNLSDLSITSPKEKATPLQKARLFAQKASGKGNRDSFLPKRKTSNADETESLVKVKSRSSSLMSSGKLKNETKKNLFQDLTSLTKPRVSISGDVSLRRSSSENRRIPATIIERSDTSSIKSHHHHHHHHLKLKSRRDGTPGNVLSSSSSNSKFISDFPALYSFHPNGNTTSTNEVLRIITSIEQDILSRSISEIKKAEYVERLLHLLYSCVLPLFKGEILSTPIEDLNKLMEVYLMLRINNNDVEKEFKSSIETNVSTSSDCKTILKEFQDFMKVGLSLMENQSNIDNITQKDSRINRFSGRFNNGSSVSFSDSNSSFSSNDTQSKNLFETENKISALWGFFLHDVLSYLEAIFLPLQLEFEGCGVILDDPEIARIFWSPLSNVEKDINVRRYLLLSFRDAIVMQMVGKLGNPNYLYLSENNAEFAKSGDLYHQKLCLLQCFGILSSIQTRDQIQMTIESFLTIMKKQIKI